MIAFSEMCAHDMYWNMLWEKEKMVKMVCENIATKVKFERIDTFCATKKLSPEKQITDAQIQKYETSCIFYYCLPVQTTNLVSATSDKNLANEIESSAEAIKSMSFSACEGLIPGPSKTDDKSTRSHFSNIDCDKHAFRNTGTWTCPQPLLPNNAEWNGDCKSHFESDSCTAVCKAGYTAESGNGVTTCKKTQKGAIPDVDVEMQFTTSSLSCRACHKCDASLEVTKQNCTFTTPTACSCRAGAIGVASDYESKTKCQLCLVGTYSSKPGEDTCQTCPDGTYADTTGSSECKTCSTCPEGKTQDKACTTKSDTTCKCAKGYAGDGQTCTQCTGNTYSDQDGSTSCKLCKSCSAKEEVKTACSGVADTECHCKPGYYGQHPTCTACPQGKYSASAGATECTDCCTCNSQFETVAAECTAVADTVCRCKNGAIGNESCFDVLKRSRK